MHSHPSLHALFTATAAQRQAAVAVEDPSSGSITYRELDALSDRVRDHLGALGVRRGDRVGFYVRKSIDVVAGFLGAMKAGAAYVPVDPGAPAWRCAYILNDCSVRVILVEERFRAGLEADLVKLGAPIPALIVLPSAGSGAALAEALDARDATQRPAPVASDAVGPEDLAYILYTSGSTGKPKGVMLTHGNALAYVDWCHDTFAPTAADRFSSHAPLHFDLSILDLYLCFRVGATLVLVGAEVGREPTGLAQLIAERRISVWYSAPSILSALAQFGKLERLDFSALRIVFFAGEVFPVKFLRLLKAQWPAPRYFNLYGPTETNVCTWHEIPSVIPAERSDPYPIGKVCANLEGKVVDVDGQDLPLGSEGELCIAGTNVMQGYWNLPDQTAAAFLTDGSGRRWYRTGDIVVLDSAADYVYVGRRDRMVKRRGHRVELNEIEAGLYRHDQVKEAAVIAHKDEDGVRIRAFLVPKDGVSLGVIALKRFCAEHLPSSMIPDEFKFLPQLPKTSTDKIDYQRLKDL
jgi:amino acid adenylation domain-containing protein